METPSSHIVRVAAAHVSPVFLDLPRTVEKTISLIHEAARGGASLVVFPETFIPAFPLWSALQAPIYNHDFFVRLAANSLRVPGPECSRLAEAARTAGIHVSVGINEGSGASVGTIWNANLFFGPDGTLLNHHRKLVPTFYEKLTWAPGDGHGLRVVDTAIGRVGMLICGENTNPLARYALMAQGEQIHLSTWPPIWPTRDPTLGAGNYDLAAAIRLRAAAHAFEAKAFNVVAAGFLDEKARTMLGAISTQAAAIIEGSPRAASMVIGPAGEPVGGSMRDEEGLLYADLDLNACVEPKQFHDVTGGYNRFDVFDLRVNRTRLQPVQFTPDKPPRPSAPAGFDDRARQPAPPSPSPRDPHLEYARR